VYGEIGGKWGKDSCYERSRKDARLTKKRKNGRKKKASCVAEKNCRIVGGSTEGTQERKQNKRACRVSITRARGEKNKKTELSSAHLGVGKRKKKNRERGKWNMEGIKKKKGRSQVPHTFGKKKAGKGKKRFRSDKKHPWPWKERAGLPRKRKNQMPWSMHICGKKPGGGTTDLLFQGKEKAFFPGLIHEGKRTPPLRKGEGRRGL